MSHEACTCPREWVSVGGGCMCSAGQGAPSCSSESSGVEAGNETSEQPRAIRADAHLPKLSRSDLMSLAQAAAVIRGDSMREGASGEEADLDVETDLYMPVVYVIARHTAAAMTAERNRLADEIEAERDRLLEMGSDMDRSEGLRVAALTKAITYADVAHLLRRST